MGYIFVYKLQSCCNNVPGSHRSTYSIDRHIFFTRKSGISFVYLHRQIRQISRCWRPRSRRDGYRIKYHPYRALDTSSLNGNLLFSIIRVGTSIEQFKWRYTSCIKNDGSNKKYDDKMTDTTTLKSSTARRVAHAN